MREFLIVATVALGSSTLRAQRIDTSQADWTGVEQALGRRGLPQPGGVMRFGFPRGDLHVSIGDVQLLPALALGGWVAFMRNGATATLMGDLVLAEDEISLVVDQLMKGGIDVTAVHNHLLGESPHVMYAHIRGQGDATRLAGSVRAALELTKTPLAQPLAVTAARI